MSPKVKLNCSAYLNEKDFDLLMAYANEHKLSKSRAIALLLTKTLQTLYKDGKRVANLDDLTTVDQVVKETENQTIDLESLEFLLRHHIATINEIKGQNQGILHRLELQQGELMNYTQEMRSFRFDFLVFKEQVIDFFQNTIKQEIWNTIHNVEQAILGLQITFQNEMQSLWFNLNQTLEPVKNALERLSQVFRI